MWLMPVQALSGKMKHTEDETQLTTKIGGKN
jgi:hypothetical protein